MNENPSSPASDDSRKSSGDNREFGKRLGILGLAMAIFFIAIAFKLLNIQVINVQKYKKKASRQYESIVMEKARRGVIYDRRGRPLAESIESISFYADPLNVKNPHDVAERFAGRFGRSKSYYLDILKAKKHFAWLERNVPVSRAKELMGQKIKGVAFRREQQRYYLNFASQLIGFTDRDDKGISGLERQLNSDLQGRDGIRIFQRSATGETYPAPDADQIDAKSGKDVMLTIDADIQGIVEDEIKETVLRLRAKAAVGIMMDVRTGEILAMANYPAFDMNHREGLTDQQTRNRAVTDMFEPGSTFKIVMATAATEALNWKAEDIVDGHNGVLPVYNRRITDHEPLGKITFREAIMHSSNIVAATTAMKVGAETFYRYARDYGFGSRTGIGLLGESPGRLKTPNTWDGTTLPWMGHGYQVMATPLQVMLAYAALANDGQLMRPYVIKRISDDEGKLVKEYGSLKVRQVLKPETARYMAREYFKAVVEKGTGSAAAVEGIEVAGKTGTAQKFNGTYQGNKAYLSSFAGFFPVENPQYAVIVVVDEPQTAYYASAVAAPAFSRICGRSIACSREIQQRLALKSVEKQILDSIKTVAVPELKGLTGREAARLLKWSNLGIEYEGNFEGVVVQQDVVAGTKVEKEKKVRVTLKAKTIKS